MSSNQSIKLSDAIRRMRELTANNVPFSIGFITCDSKNRKSKGYRVVSKALLRSSMRPEQSEKSDLLIAYLDCEDIKSDKNRFFYYPLLMMFNGLNIEL